MWKFTLIFLIGVGCGSPRNHRVLSGDEVTSKTQVPLLFTQNQLTAKVFWAEGPLASLQIPSQLVIYLFDQNKKLVPLPAGKDLGFLAEMPDMGHGLDQPGYFEMVSPGIYVNREIVFNMTGIWKMRLLLLDEQGNKEEEIQWNESF